MAPEERYNITQRLAQPCGITLYSATDRLTEDKRWMWRLYEFESTQPRPTQERVQQLAKKLLAYEHDYSVKVVDAYVDDEGLVAAMEPPRGLPLDLFAATYRLDERCLGQIALPCIEALRAMHAAGLTHGSIEPGVIFCEVLPDGNISTQLFGVGLIDLTYQVQGDTVEVTLEEDLHHLGRSLYIGMGGPSMRDVAVLKPIHNTREDLSAAVCDWMMNLVHPDAGRRISQPEVAIQKLQEILAQSNGPIPGTVNWQAVPVGGSAKQDNGYVLTPATPTTGALAATASSAAVKIELGAITAPLAKSATSSHAVGAETETKRLHAKPKTAAIPILKTDTARLHIIYDDTVPGPQPVAQAIEKKSQWDNVSWTLALGGAVLALLTMVYMCLRLTSKL
jgi:hypothetical protein